MLDNTHMGSCCGKVKSGKVGAVVRINIPTEVKETSDTRETRETSDTSDTSELKRTPSQDSDAMSQSSHDHHNSWYMTHRGMWDSDSGSPLEMLRTESSCSRSPTSFGSFSGPGEFSDSCSSMSSSVSRWTEISREYVFNIWNEDTCLTE